MGWFDRFHHPSGDDAALSERAAPLPAAVVLPWPLRATDAGDLTQLDRLDLPPGRLVSATDAASADACLWVTEATGDHRALWADLAPKFPATGLWPLLVDDLSRPWHSGELDGAQAVPPLEQVWDSGAAQALGEPTPAHVDVPTDLLPPQSGLVLVAATRPADVLAAIGWQGPCNLGLSGGGASAFLRSWEQRYATVPVCVGFDTLTLFVGAPPSASVIGDVAVEHQLFCPDNIEQGSGSIERSFEQYAEDLQGQDTWQFWWD